MDSHAYPCHMNDGKHLLYVRQEGANHFVFGLRPQPQHKGMVSVQRQDTISADFLKSRPANTG